MHTLQKGQDGVQIHVMAKEYEVFQTQHRLKFDQVFEERQKDGWELAGPVQFQVFPGKNLTYYLCTFVREKDEVGSTKEVD
jgi:hypothetical protein